MTTEDLRRFPIGPFAAGGERNALTRAEAIRTLADAPATLARLVEALTDRQLASTYRPGGWDIRQLVHHLADSHAIGFVRFKLGLTEFSPEVPAYDQDKFAALADAKLPPGVSLRLLASVHERWVQVLRSMSDDEFSRTAVLPRGRMSLDDVLHMYAWHARHHLAHVAIALDEAMAADARA